MFLTGKKQWRVSTDIWFVINIHYQWLTGNLKSCFCDCAGLLQFQINRWRFFLFPPQANVQNIWLWPFLTLAIRELFPEPVMTECGPFFKWEFANSNTCTNQVQSGDSSHSFPEWSPDSMKNTTGLHSIWPWFSLFCSRGCQIIITVSQFHKWLEIILKVSAIMMEGF